MSQVFDDRDDDVSTFGDGEIGDENANEKQVEDSMHPMDFPAAQEQTDNVELLESNGQLRTYKGQRAAGDSVTESSRREEAVRGDDRFKEHTKRARIRIIEITNRAKEQASLNEQGVVDCGDDSEDPLGAKYKMETCSNGNYIQEYPDPSNNLKRPRLRRITDEELAAAAAEEEASPCPCSVCTKRWKNQYDVTVGTRSGHLRGCEKYGTERVLGSGKEARGR